MGRKRPNSYDYDLISIGSGAGGSVASHIAAGKKKRVAIVEEDRPGGECPNWGCVPTKALLQAADTLNNIRSASDFGVKATDIGVNQTAVQRWKDLAVERTGVTHGKDIYERDGIDIIRGRAHFITPYEISVNGKRFTARKFMIATGASTRIPPIAGLGDVGFITHRQAISLKPPKSMAIIGGGPIGVEFAHIFSSFGTKVTILERSPRLLPNEEPEVGALIQKLFEAEKLTIATGVEVNEISKEQGQKVIKWQEAGKQKSIKVDDILVSTGIQPNVDLGLENADVHYDGRGIKTSTTMQTSANNIYAAGDVTGPFAFTHMASYQSRIAAHNMFSSTKVHANYNAVPRCVFTWPEVASVGLTEVMASQQKTKIESAIVPISIIGRANTANFSDGFVKVIVNKKSRKILGASIVSPRAGEMIHELTLAINNNLTAEDVADTIHAFPTWSEAVRVACAQLT